MIVGITGLIGSGKDTAADYLCTFHGYKRMSFAGTLKDAVAAVFDWNRELLEGSTKHSREWREQVDTWWAERLRIPNLTPRWVLQYWGTEVCRKAFHNDIWIASLENKLRTKNGNTVITDCRFPNEIDTIRKQGGKVVWVRRGPLPEWYDSAVSWSDQSLYEVNDLDILMGKRYPGVHASEYSWIGATFDHVIYNDGTIQDLYDTVEKQLVVNL